jgi:hypothetical protein
LTVTRLKSFVVDVFPNVTAPAFVTPDREHLDEDPQGLDSA